MSRRCIGVDVHRDFCEVAIWEEGRVSRGGRIASRPEALESYARSLRPTDEVALEATSGARQLAEVVRPHVARVVIANTPSPGDRGVEEEDRPPGRPHARPAAGR